jgi:ABC-type glycerol-3-phosphate transport system substrate-binding protein
MRRALVVAALVLAASGAAARGAPAPVTLQTSWNGPAGDALAQAAARFTRETGIQVRIDRVPDVGAALAGGHPDLAIVPTPALLDRLADAGRLTKLDDLGIEEDDLENEVGETWESVGDEYGIVLNARADDLVWYRPSVLRRAGAPAPSSWDSLARATAALRRAGLAPWALAGATPAALAEWFASVYLRSSGYYAYQQLVSGAKPFSDPSVLAAVRTMLGTLGPEAKRMLGTTPAEAVRAVLGKPPAAGLLLADGSVGAGTGDDVAAAALPAITSRWGSPLVGRVDLLVALDAKTATRKLVTYLLGPRAARVLAGRGAIVSPSTGVPPAAYPNAILRAEAAHVRETGAFAQPPAALLAARREAALERTLQAIVRRPADAETLLAQLH